MWILLLFSYLSSFADEPSSEKYCFPNTISSEVAQKKFSAIQVPSDVVTLEPSCLIIQMSPHRRELIQRYMLSSIPGSFVSFSSENFKKEPCKLVIEKIKTTQSNATTAQYDQNFSVVNNSHAHESKETTEVITLNDFTMTVNQDEIQGSCKFISAKRYEITLSMRKYPSSDPQKTQEGSALQTQVQLSHGEKIEVSKILRKLNDKDHVVIINPSLILETRNHESSEIVFLRIQ
jgi:hypothetical protein